MYLDKLIKYFRIRNVISYFYNIVPKYWTFVGNIFTNSDIILVLIWVEIQPSPHCLYEILDVELIYGCIRWRFADVFPRLQLSNKFLFFQFCRDLLLIIIFVSRFTCCKRFPNPSLFYEKQYYKKSWKCWYMNMTTYNTNNTNTIYMV